MPRTPVDLSAHINQTVHRGHPADFPVGVVRLFHERDGAYEQVPKRLAVVRPDTGQILSVVSERYTLVPHQRILDAVDEAVAPLDVGPVPRGVFVDRLGARMRAILKFPALARPVTSGDTICPCLKVENSYDTRSRIAIHIGAFRFVCTNLAVGGGGVFAGGFVSVHAGEIPIPAMAQELASFLSAFDQIVELYRVWAETQLSDTILVVALEGLPPKALAEVGRRMIAANATSVFDAHNVATDYATHATRSYRTAFDLLARVNRGFQEAAPLARLAGREVPAALPAAATA